MDYKALMREFMLKPAPSGYEKLMAYRLKEEFEKTADRVGIDRIGNVLAEYRGGDPNAPVVMVFAHLDSLGFIVRRIEDDGFIQVDRLGGIPEKVLPGLNVQILTKDGEVVDGVFGNKSHHAAAESDKYKVDLVTSLFIDIGAASSQQVRERGIDIGCPVVYAPQFKELCGDFISGTSVDNRGGLLGMVVAANELKKKAHDATVYFVGTVWEEFNLRGAMIAARSIQPDISICLDVVLAGDTPDLKQRYEDRCGKGPAVVLYSFHGRGTLNGLLPHNGLVRLAEKAAEEEGIPLQRFASLGILTDSSYIQLEGKGVCAVDLGFPARYTHTPVEVANMNDIVGMGKLVAAMAARIDRSFSLDRY